MIRVGVIGTGFIGKVHIEQIRRLGFAEVVALADVGKAEETAARLNVPEGYSDYKEMIRAEKPDIVHICTPNHTHYDIAMYAMEQSCNVVCEKPISLQAEEAEKMADLAAKKGLVNALNLHNRFFPMVQELSVMVKKGELGDIHAVNGWYLQDWLLYNSDFDWRVMSKCSGKTRAVSDIGSHWMDTAEFVIGSKVTEVFADLKCLHPQRKKYKAAGTTYSGIEPDADEYELVNVDTEDHANILLHFENGAVGNVTVSQVMAGRKASLNLNIGGGIASAEWCTDSSDKLWVGSRTAGNMLLEKEPGLMYPEAAKYANLPGGHGEGFADAVKNNFSEIYSALLNGAGKGNYASFEDGLHILRVCDAVYESSHSGNWIKI